MGKPIPKYFIGGGSTTPSVTTNAATSVLKYKSTGNGNVTSDGGATITARGFVYSVTSVNGTPAIGGTGVTTTTVSGTTGSYTGDLGPSANENLLSSTGYSYRAYATNSKGTSYGATQTFTTTAATSVALNSPADSATGVSTTPALQFTGTDPDGLEVEYEVQVDMAATFDSQGGGGGTYYFDGSDVAATDASNAWNNETNSDDGDTATYAQATAQGVEQTAPTPPTNSIKIGGTNAPSTGSTITQVQLRLRSDDAYGSYITLNTPTGGWSWSVVQGLIVYIAGNMLGTVVAVCDTSSEERLCSFTLGNRPSATSSSGDSRVSLVEIEVTAADIPLLTTLSSTDDDANWTGTGAPNPFPSGNAITYTIPAGSELDPSTEYFWRVRAIDPLGSNTYGAWATTRSFTTESGSTVEEATATTASTTLSVVTPTKSYVQVNTTNHSAVALSLTVAAVTASYVLIGSNTPNPVSLTSSVVTPETSYSSIHTRTPNPVSTTLSVVSPAVSYTYVGSNTPNPVSMTLTPVDPTKSYVSVLGNTPDPVSLTTTPIDATTSYESVFANTPNPVSVTSAVVTPSSTYLSVLSRTPDPVVLNISVQSVTRTFEDDDSPASVVLSLSVQSPTTSYVQVNANTPNSVSTTLSVITPSTDYSESSAATHSPLSLTLTPITPSASYVQVGSNTPEPLFISTTPVAPTTSYVQVETASHSPVVITTTIPTQSSGYTAGGETTPTPVQLSLTPITPTTSYVQEETTSIKDLIGGGIIAFPR